MFVASQQENERRELLSDQSAAHIMRVSLVVAFVVVVRPCHFFLLHDSFIHSFLFVFIFQCNVSDDQGALKDVKNNDLVMTIESKCKYSIAVFVCLVRSRFVANGLATSHDHHHLPSQLLLLFFASIDWAQCLNT